MDFYRNVIYKQKNTIAKYHPCKSNAKEINTIIVKYKQYCEEHLTWKSGFAEKYMMVPTQFTNLPKFF